MPRGMAAELAVGFGLAQQMMKDGFMSGHATPTIAVPSQPAAPAGMPEPQPRRSGAGARCHRGRRDGRPRVWRVERPKDRPTWRIPRAAITSYMS